MHIVKKIKIIKKNILKPEIKTIAIQEKVNSKVWPKSGWLIKNTLISIKSKKENAYLL